MPLRNSLLTWIVFAVAVQAQQAAPPTAENGAKHRAAYYIDTSALNIDALLPNPPAVGSPENNNELAELHRIENRRTPDEVAQAKADDAQEDMFAFKTVFGAAFT